MHFPVFQFRSTIMYPEKVKAWQFFAFFHSKGKEKAPEDIPEAMSHFFSLS